MVRNGETGRFSYVCTGARWWSSCRTRSDLLALNHQRRPDEFSVHTQPWTDLTKRQPFTIEADRRVSSSDDMLDRGEVEVASEHPVPFSEKCIERVHDLGDAPMLTL